MGCAGPPASSEAAAKWRFLDEGKRKAPVRLFGADPSSLRQGPALQQPPGVLLRPGVGDLHRRSRSQHTGSCLYEGSRAARQHCLSSNLQNKHENLSVSPRMAAAGLCEAGLW